MDNDLTHLTLDESFNVIYHHPAIRESYPGLLRRGFFKDLLHGCSPEDFRRPVRLNTDLSGSAPISLIFVRSEEGINCIVAKNKIHGPSNAQRNLQYQMREPISGIFALLPVIADNINKSDSNKAVANLQAIYGQSYKLLRSVSNISMASNIFSGAVLRKETCDFSELVSELCESVKLVVRNINIECTAEKNLYIYANYQMICCAFLNLISNSVNYKNDRDVHIKVTLTKKDSMAVLTYSDNSKGIKDDYLPFVFRPYFSKDPYNDGESDPSLGMGLFIAKAAFEQAGGNILLTSKFGQGVKYTISLPLDNAGGQILESSKADFLLNKYSDLFIQLCDCRQLPGL